MISFKIIFGLVLSLVYVCMCKETNYLFYSYVNKEGKTIVESTDSQLNPVNVPNWTAQAYYNASQNYTGWDLLEIRSNPSMPDDIQAYYSGYIEGYITRQQIWNYFYNSIDEITSNKSNKANDILKEYFENNTQFIKEKSENGSDPFWYQVNLTYIQLYGLWEGYNNATKDQNITDQILTMNHFMYMHFMEELPDIVLAYLVQHPNSTHKETSNGHKHTSDKVTYQLNDHFKDFGSHCSALIKVVPGNSDVFIGHDTWSGYSTMNRILKRYTLAFKVSKNSSELIPGMNTAFSSYPGVLASVDDFYVMSSGIVTLETTNEVYSNELYKKYVHSQNTVLEEVRNIVANRLATNGSTWMAQFTKENSGTYNNQWMVIDFNKFKPGFDPEEGFLSVFEQAPGTTIGRDQTDHLLKHGYWASYNIPFYPDIYNITGNAEAANKNSWNSYSECPRAKIFKRQQSEVIDMETMIQMMRYNHYKTDAYSKCDECTPEINACNAIASRCDLNPIDGNYSALPAVRPSLFGAIDAKIVSFSLFSKGEMLAIGGPTTSSGLPPFSWSATKMNTTGVRHLGQPDVWDFKPLVTSWLLPYKVKAPVDTAPTTDEPSATTPKHKKSSSNVFKPVSIVISVITALLVFKA